MHAGAFEAGADGHLATGFDDASGSAQGLFVELRIAHPVAIGFEVVEALPGLFARRDLPGDGLQESVEPSVVEFRLTGRSGRTRRPASDKRSPPFREFRT